MIQKIKEKQIAIELRKKGLSYREILQEIHVSKSSLSLWLKEVGLSKSQKQKLTEKKLAAGRRGAEARKNQRITLTKKIFEKAINQIGGISKRELFLIGVCLYWGEGSKQKITNVSQITRLTNSDPKLVSVCLKWLRDICNISKEDIYFRIYLHETAKERLSEVREYWSKATDFPIEYFSAVSWKKNKINTKRKNIGDKYMGLVTICVKRSANFNRKISGWIEGICKAI